MLRAGKILLVGLLVGLLPAARERLQKVVFRTMIYDTLLSGNCLEEQFFFEKCSCVEILNETIYLFSWSHENL